MTNQELRIAIAKAKGYKWFGNSKAVVLIDGNLWPQSEYLTEEPDLKTVINLYCPDWPNDPIAARELIQEMQRSECVVIIVYNLDGRGYVHVSPLGKGIDMFGVYGDTVEQATSLAWLKWDSSRRVE